jgi:protein-S-isoprenylcysteine O-methyltransferase Ste14
MDHAAGQDTETKGPLLPVKRIVALVLAVTGYGSLLFLAAGTLDWWQAWVYLCLQLVILTAMLILMATPLLLGTPWAFLPVGAIFVVILIRTALEDRVLRRELPGYQEYARRVRKRLFPGIW